MFIKINEYMYLFLAPLKYNKAFNIAVLMSTLIDF